MKLNNFLKEIKEILSFSSKYRLIIFTIILFLLAIIPLNFLENNIPNLSLCSWIFKDYCYSRGITRGVSALLKGNFVQAINYNWLAIPVLALLIFFIVYDFFRKRK